MKLQLKPQLRPIPNFPDYFASDDGEIYSMKPINQFTQIPEKPRMLKKSLDKDGYFRVTLRKDKSAVIRRVSALILETFVSSRPDGMLACHGINGKRNNSINNLYWGSPSRNSGLDKIRDGTMQNGEKNGFAKLTEAQVREIKRLYSSYGKNGLTQQELAKKFNISDTTIYQIVRGITWKHTRLNLKLKLEYSNACIEERF